MVAIVAASTDSVLAAVLPVTAPLTRLSATDRVESVIVPPRVAMLTPPVAGEPGKSLAMPDSAMPNPGPPVVGSCKASLSVPVGSRPKTVSKSVALRSRRLPTCVHPPPGPVKAATAAA